MNEDASSLSIVTLFLNADPVVKGVMILLLAASIWCWGVIVDKLFNLGAASRIARGYEQRAAAARIASGDRQRLTRAMEVFAATGRSLTDWRAATRPPLAPDAWRGVVLSLPRSVLYARIDARLDAMAKGT